MTKVLPNPIHGDGHNIMQSNGFLWPCRCYSPSKIVTRLFLIHSLLLPEEKCDINNISCKSLTSWFICLMINVVFGGRCATLTLGWKSSINGGWPRALLSSKRMFFSKQYFSTYRIKWWKNKSWKIVCVTRFWGYSSKQQKEPLTLFSRAFGFSEW